MEASEQWGILAPLAKAVMEGKIDGFELPYELIYLAKDIWPDGRKVARYKLYSGELFFVEGAYVNYGYPSADSFVTDAKNRLVISKTAAGALSLGRARKKPDSSAYILLSMPMAISPMIFVGQAGDEIVEMQRLLKEWYPEAKIELSETESGRISWTIPEELKKMGWGDFKRKFRELGAVQKKSFVIILVATIVGMFLSFMSFFKLIYPWIDLLVMVAYVLILLIHAPRLRK